jgi:DNA-binding CsgD family transcriptional regulator
LGVLPTFFVGGTFAKNTEPKVKARNDIAIPARSLCRQAQHLSPAEKEIIYWLKFGKNNSKIAQILGKSEHTIKTQIHKMLIKTRAVNRTALALLDA